MSNMQAQQSFLAMSELLGPRHPIILCQNADGQVNLFNKHGSKLKSLRLPGVSFAQLCNGTVVAMSDKCKPFEIHVNEFEPHGLVALEWFEQPDKRLRVISKDLLERVGRDKLSELLCEIADENELFCLVAVLRDNNPEVSFPRFVLTELGMEESIPDLTNWEKIRIWLQSSHDEANEEVAEILEDSTKLRNAALRLARMNVSVLSGRLRHVDSGLVLPLADSLELRYLIEAPEEELAGFGCKPPKISLAESLSYSSFLALQTVAVSEEEQETVSISLPNVVVAADHPMFALYNFDKGVVEVFGQADFKNGLTCCKAYSVNIGTDPAGTALAIRSRSNYGRMRPVEEYLNERYGQNQSKFFPGMAVTVKLAGDQSLATGSIVNIDGEMVSVDLIEETGSIKRVEVKMEAVEKATLEVGRVVFLLPFEGDVKGKGRIGRLISSTSTGEASTHLVRLAGEDVFDVQVTDSKQAIPRNTFVPPAVGFNLADWNSPMPIWYPPSLIVPLAPSLIERFGIEAKLETEFGASAFSTLALVRIDGSLSVFESKLDGTTKEVSRLERKILNPDNGNTAFLGVWFANESLLVLTQRGHLYRIDLEMQNLDLKFLRPVHVFCVEEGAQLTSKENQTHLAIYVSSPSTLIVLEKSEHLPVILCEMLDQPFIPSGLTASGITGFYGNETNRSMREFHFAKLNQASSPTESRVNVDEMLQALTWKDSPSTGRKNEQSGWQISSFPPRSFNVDCKAHELTLTSLGEWTVVPVDLEGNGNNAELVIEEVKVKVIEGVESVEVDSLEPSFGVLKVVQKHKETEYVFQPVNKTSKILVKLSCPRPIATITPKEPCARVYVKCRPILQKEDAIRAHLASAETGEQLLNHATESGLAAKPLRRKSTMLLTRMLETEYCSKEWAVNMLKDPSKTRLTALFKAHLLTDFEDDSIQEFVSVLLAKFDRLAREAIHEALIDIVLSDDVEVAMTRAGLCQLLVLFGSNSKEVSNLDLSPILARLVRISERLLTEENPRFTQLRQRFICGWNVFENDLLDGVTYKDRRTLDLTHPSKAHMAENISGFEVPSAAKVDALMTSASEEYRANLPVSTLALKSVLELTNKIKLATDWDVLEEFSPEDRLERMCGRLSVGESSRRRLDVKIHSHTHGIITCFRTDQYDDQCLDIVFTDISARSNESVIILDLSEVRALTSGTLQLSFVDIDAATYQDIMSFGITIDSFVNTPPFVGERMAYPARDARGVPFDIEMHACSGAFSFDKKDGVVGVKSVFPTVAPRGVSITSGKWYYEVVLIKTGDSVAQIGWCDSLFSGEDKQETGTGDDEHSWAFDGHRVKKWSGVSTSWGKKWKEGDVVGCAIDIEERKVMFSLNGSWRKPMGIAFSNINIAGGVFPALTAEKVFKCKMNFGQIPFKFAPPSEAFQPVFSWILENREATAKLPQGKPWLRKQMDNKNTKDYEFKIEEGQVRLARYLRISVSMRDWVDVDGDLPIDQRYIAKHTEVGQAKPKALPRPRVQTRLAISLAGSSSPLWVSRAIASSMTIESACKMLRSQQSALEQELTKLRVSVETGRSALAESLDAFENVRNLTSRPWTATDYVLVSQQGEDANVVSAFPAIHQAAIQVIRTQDALVRTMRQVLETENRLAAIESELGRLDPHFVSGFLANLRTASASDVLGMTGQFLCTLLLANGTSNSEAWKKISLPPVDQLLVLYRAIYVEALTLHVDGAEGLFQEIMKKCASPEYSAEFLAKLCEMQQATTKTNGTPWMTSPVPLTLALSVFKLDNVRRVVARLIQSKCWMGLYRVLEETKIRVLVEPASIGSEAVELAQEILSSEIVLEDPIMTWKMLVQLRSISYGAEEFLEKLLALESFRVFVSQACGDVKCIRLARGEIAALLDLPKGSSETSLLDLTRPIALQLVSIDEELGLELMAMFFVSSSSCLSLSDEEIDAFKLVLDKIKSMSNPSLCLSLIARLLSLDDSRARETKGLEIVQKLVRACLDFSFREYAQTVAEDIVRLIGGCSRRLKRKLLVDFVDLFCGRRTVPINEQLCVGIFHGLLLESEASSDDTKLSPVDDLDSQIGSSLVLRLLNDFCLSLHVMDEKDLFTLMLLKDILDGCEKMLGMDDDLSATKSSSSASIQQIPLQSCIQMAQWMIQVESNSAPSELILCKRRLMNSIAKIFLRGSKSGAFVFIDAILQVCCDPPQNGDVDTLVQLAMEMIHESEKTALHAAQSILESFTQSSWGLINPNRPSNELSFNVESVGQQNSAMIEDFLVNRQAQKSKFPLVLRFNEPKLDRFEIYIRLAGEAGSSISSVTVETSPNSPSGAVNAKVESIAVQIGSFYNSLVQAGVTFRASNASGTDNVKQNKTFVVHCNSEMVHSSSRFARLVIHVKRDTESDSQSSKPSLLSIADRDAIWFRKGDKVRMVLPSSQQDDLKAKMTDGSRDEVAYVVDVDGELVSVRWAQSSRLDVLPRTQLDLVLGSSSSSSSTSARPSSSFSSTTAVATIATTTTASARNAGDNTTATEAPIALVIQNIVIHGRPMEIVEPFVERVCFLKSLAAACDKFESVGERLVASDLVESTKNLLVRMIQSTIRVPRGLFCTLASKSPSLGLNLMQAVLARPSSRLGQHALSICVSLCCDTNLNKDFVHERARLLLERCRRDLTNDAMVAIPQLKSWVILLEELGIRRGMDLNIGEQDMQIALSVLNRCQSGFSLELAVQLVHRLVRLSDLAKRVTLDVIDSKFTELISSDHGVRVLGFIAVSCPQAVDRCLNKMSNLLPGDWYANRELVICLTQMARIFRRVRKWLREQGLLRALLKVVLTSPLDDDDSKQSSYLELIVAAMNRDLANQELIAKAIAGYLSSQKPTSSASLLTKDDMTSKLLLVASKFENHVHLSVWNLSFQLDMLARIEHAFLAKAPVDSFIETPYTLDSIPSSTNASSTARSGGFKLSQTACGKTIEVSPNGYSATQIAVEKWGVVRADSELPLSGTSWWEVRLDHSPKGHIFVGVATSRSNVDGYLGCDKYGWGFIGNKGIWHNKHKENTYGKEFRSGDTVRVILNASEGTLSFALNGEDLGVAFSNLGGLKLYPAFSMYQKGDKFTITNMSVMMTEAPASSAKSALFGNPSESLDISADITDFSGTGVVDETESGDSQQTTPASGGGKDPNNNVSNGKNGLVHTRVPSMRFASPGELFHIRETVRADRVWTLIGRQAMVNALKAKYGREETRRLDYNPDAGFEVEIRGLDNKKMDASFEESSIGFLVDVSEGDSDIIEMDVSVNL